MAKRSRAKPRVSGPTPRRLNERQEELKKLLISTGSLVSNHEAADQLGVSETTIWRDRRVIQALQGPRTLEGFDEDDAIRESLDFYDQAIAVLISRLDLIVQFEKEKREELSKIPSLGGESTRPRSRVFNPVNSGALFVQTMTAIATFRKDLNGFLLDTGLVKSAPIRIEAELKTPLGDLNANQIKERLAQNKRDITRLRSLVNGSKKKPGPKKKASKKAAGK